MCTRYEGHIEPRLKGQRVTDRQPEQSDGDTAMNLADKVCYEPPHLQHG
ncbi:MAG: hypothetical protein PUD20_04295 [bacterium]|nr:hypothetical protein [bacterium]